MTRFLLNWFRETSLFKGLSEGFEEWARGNLPKAFSAEEEALFYEHAGRQSLFYGQIVTCFAILGEFIWWPSDFLVFPSGGPVEMLALVRVGIVAVGLIALHCAGYFRKKVPSPFPWITLTFFFMIVLAFSLMGYAGGPEYPLIYTGYTVPPITVVFLLSFRPRVLLNLCTVLLIFCSYYLPHPEFFDYPYNASILIFLVFSGCVSVGIGHLLYLLARMNFFQQRYLALHAGKLEELDRMKDSFFASISHELRTPLNAILGFSEVLLDEASTPDQRKYLTTIQHSGNVLLRLINDILDFSRIRAGKFPMEDVEFDLREMVSETVSLFSLPCEQKGISLATNVAPSVSARIISDPFRLKQVLFNLLSNAMKFTEKGVIQVWVSAVAPPTPFPQLQFQVSDSGVGIPSAMLTKIFEEFTQADPSITRKFGGTGLGLSISWHLVRALGGSIRAENNTLGGASFFFTIPLHLPTNPREGMTSSQEAPSRRSDAAPKPLENLVESPIKVLLVDDLEENRNLVKAFLRKLPVIVVSASNGQEALNLLQKEPFALVLMDLEMPELDGFSTTEEIRAWEKNRGVAGVPIVAVTAHALEDYRLKAFKLGFNGYLTKPLHQKDLIQVLEHHAVFLDEDEGGEQLPEPGEGLEDDPVYQALAADYLVRKQKEVETLRQRAQEGNLAEISRIGHQLKGSGKSFGYTPISELGDRLEAAAHNGDQEAAQKIVEELAGYLESMKKKS